MSVQTEIDRISTAVQNAHLKVIEKGGTSTAPYLVGNLAEAIGTIPEASEPTLQSKSVTPTESAQTVKPDTGYDGLSQVSVGAISKTYVGSSVPKQAAKTITPTKSSQTAVASGRYTTGAVTVAAIPDIYEDNTTMLAILNNVNGGTAATSMAGAVSNTETIKNEQADLISQIQTALEGKAAGGGSGGVETCTVVLNHSSSADGRIILACAVVLEDGVRTMKTGYRNAVNGSNVGDFDFTQNPITIENVVCNSQMMLVTYIDSGVDGYTIDKAELVHRGAMGDSSRQKGAIFKITAPAGGTATITIYDAD